MQVINALQAKGGQKVEQNRMGNITQPLQFLPRAEKDDEWYANNVDWLEWNGLRQIERNASKLMKNYKLARGIIDRSDYIVEQDNEYQDLIDTLTEENESALELKFYPIIPNAINTLVSEFAKRDTKVSFLAVDEYSYNEMLEQKSAEVEKTLVSDAQMKMVERMIQMGLDPESEEAKASLNPEKIKTLPEIQKFYSKTWRSTMEEWATHQMVDDVNRFKMDELEEMGFRDMLIADREFWHFRMMEDDYEIELWNPLLTFYHKSPDKRYTSEGNHVGKVDMMTAADVVDNFGPIMTQEQLESLEAAYPIKAAGYALSGYQNDGNFYDGTKSHAWNVNPPSLGYRQFTSMFDNFVHSGTDIVSLILNQSEDFSDFGTNYLLRVTTVYWKSQRKVGHLTKVMDTGEVITRIVDEDYKVTCHPIYNTNLIANKTEDNLVYGEHINWIWINYTVGAVKIGPNMPSYWGMNNSSGISPIYLGIMQNKPGPLKYQFKGDNNLYGCKLPVEGCVFSDRNTKSHGFVDLMKPHQIGYNLVNNQIADILVDELGTVILLDQNTLPKHSLGEDWGKSPYANAYVAMKNFSMLPVDTGIQNTETPLNFSHFQTLDMQQTNRLLTRVNLATYFKTQALEVIGITPQRIGQQIAQTNNATGIEQAVVASYNQTETYFINHCDNLMPRVHQMRTDLAAFYLSTKPSKRLQYLTTLDERVSFEIEGTNALLREINVHCTTKANHRSVVESLKRLATENNTTGANIYDLGNILQSNSMAEINHVLKNIDKKVQMQREEDALNAQRLKEIEQETALKEEQMREDHEARENEKNRRRDILVAEIRSAAFTAMPKSDETDYLDAIERIHESDQYQQQMNTEQTKMTLDQTKHNDKISIERQKLAVQQKVSDNNLKIAQENKTKAELGKIDKAKKAGKK